LAKGIEVCTQPSVLEKTNTLGPSSRQEARKITAINSVHAA